MHALGAPMGWSCLLHIQAPLEDKHDTEDGEEREDMSKEEAEVEAEAKTDAEDEEEEASDEEEEEGAEVAAAQPEAPAAPPPAEEEESEAAEPAAAGASLEGVAGDTHTSNQLELKKMCATTVDSSSHDHLCLLCGALCGITTC